MIRKSIHARTLVLYAITLSAGILQLSGALAASWVVEPRLDQSISYIDNINLDSSGSERQEGIVEISPSLSIQLDGQHATADMMYRMQNIIYARDYIGPEQGLSRIYHQLDGTLNTEIVKDTLGLDARIYYTQVTRPGKLSTAFDNYSLNGNLVNTAQGTLSPYAIFAFRDYAEIDVRYSLRQVDYSGSNEFDAETTAMNISIQSGKRFNRLSWSVKGKRSKIQYDTQAGISINSADIKTIYKLQSGLSLLANVGYDKNSYQRLAGQELPQGRSWSSGLVWRKGASTVIKILAGERYYGETLSLMFQHKSRKYQWLLSYEEDVVTAATAATGSVNNAYQRLNPLTTTEAYIRNRLTLEQIVTRKKSRMRMTATYEKNEYQLSGSNEHILMGHASWRMIMTGRSSLTFTEYGQYIQYKDSSIKALLHRFSIDLRRQGNKYISTNISYRYTRRYTNNNVAEYQQNHLEMGIRLDY